MLSSSVHHALSFLAVCPQPSEPENGGYICHPTPCKDPLTSGSVIEYLCEEGYMLKGDYKYLTCKNGKWDPVMEVTCRLSPGQFLLSANVLPSFFHVVVFSPKLFKDWTVTRFLAKFLQKKLS